jgi:hypothetical protein
MLQRKQRSRCRILPICSATRAEVSDAISVVIERLTKGDGQTVEAILKDLAQSTPPEVK